MPSGIPILFFGNASQLSYSDRSNQPSRSEAAWKTPKIKIWSSFDSNMITLGIAPQLLLGMLNKHSQMILVLQKSFQSEHGPRHENDFQVRLKYYLSTTSLHLDQPRPGDESVVHMILEICTSVLWSINFVERIICPFMLKQPFLSRKSASISG